MGRLGVRHPKKVFDPIHTNAHAHALYVCIHVCHVYLCVCVCVACVCSCRDVPLMRQQQPCHCCFTANGLVLLLSLLHLLRGRPPARTLSLPVSFSPSSSLNPPPPPLPPPSLLYLCCSRDAATHAGKPSRPLATKLLGKCRFIDTSLKSGPPRHGLKGALQVHPRKASDACTLRVVIGFRI